MTIRVSTNTPQKPTAQRPLLRRHDTTPARSSSTPTPEEILERYPPGTPVSGKVWKVVANLQRAWIDVHAGQAGAIAARDVGPLGVLRINQALQPGQNVEGISLGVTGRPDGPQVQVALPDMPVPTVDQQLRTAGVVPGARFDGRTLKLFGASGLFVEILPGIKGLLETDWHDLTRYTPGTMLRIVVETAHENPTKPGRASVRLTLEP